MWSIAFLKMPMLNSRSVLRLHCVQNCVFFIGVPCTKYVYNLFVHICVYCFYFTCLYIFIVYDVSDTIWWKQIPFMLSIIHRLCCLLRLLSGHSVRDKGFNSVCLFYIVLNRDLFLHTLSHIFYTSHTFSTYHIPSVFLLYTRLYGLLVERQGEYFLVENVPFECVNFEGKNYMFLIVMIYICCLICYSH